jgi:hypothetical protein
MSDGRASGKRLARLWLWCGWRGEGDLDGQAAAGPGLRGDGGGAVALLVGAVGVANIMIISVLERRQEIGLRRALGATKGQIRAQFLAEAILLTLAGGAAGDIAGVVATAIYAHAKGWATTIPPKRGPAAWGPLSSSDSCPPSAPRACPPHKHSGPSDTTQTVDAHSGG